MSCRNICSFFLNLLKFIVSVEIDKYADVDSRDGEDDAGKGDGCKFVYEFDADEHHHPHDEEQTSSVYAEVVIHSLWVFRKIAEDWQPRSHVRLPRR